MVVYLIFPLKEHKILSLLHSGTHYYTNRTGREEDCAFYCAAKISCGSGFVCSVVKCSEEELIMIALLWNFIKNFVFSFCYYWCYKSVRSLF